MAPLSSFHALYDGEIREKRKEKERENLSDCMSAGYPSNTLLGSIERQGSGSPILLLCLVRQTQEKRKGKDTENISGSTSGN